MNWACLVAFLVFTVIVACLICLQLLINLRGRNIVSSHKEIYILRGKSSSKGEKKKVWLLSLPVYGRMGFFGLMGVVASGGYGFLFMLCGNHDIPSILDKVLEILREIFEFFRQNKRQAIENAP